MIKGIVTGVDGTSVSVKIGDDTETRVGFDRVHTKIEYRNAEDAEFKKGTPAQIANGDFIEVRGENPLRATSARVTKGGPAGVEEARLFNESKRTPVQAVAVQAPESKVHSLPAERLKTVGEAPPEVEYGGRRKWREAEEKKIAREQGLKAGEDYVKQEADDDGDDHEDLKSMTKADLEALAEKEGIEVTKSGTHADHVKEIRAGRRKAARAK
jgi:hypothetical protein